MSDPGDLIGLPRLNNESGKTEFMPPYWFPTDGKPIVLFLDELNRARPEVLQTIMDLALNRKLAGRTLPKGSRIISAVNDGEEYQLTDLDPAPEIIRLKAIKGRVIDRRREHRDSVEAYNTLDTVRYRQAAVEASTEHTATTRLYNPPDGTIISVAALLAAAVLIWLFLRKR